MLENWQLAIKLRRPKETSKRVKLLKVLVVTSQITYIPGNYQQLLRGLLEFGQNTPEIEVVALVAIKTLNTSLLKTVMGLPFIGVRELPKSIAKNILSLPLKERSRLSREFKTPYLTWESMNSKEAIDFVKMESVDLVLNLRTRDIYKSEILKAPRLGCINLHHGLLPDYRGTFCDLYALSEKRPAGFSLHKMEKKIDHGDIYAVEIVSKDYEKNYMQYLKRTEAKELEAIKAFLKSIIKTNELPKGKKNMSKNINYSKNPDKQQIRKFLAQGMIL